MSKYKVGDKVKIKKQHECQAILNIMEKDIKNLNTNRIVEIKNISQHFYHMKKIKWVWTDNMIECLDSEYKEPEIFEPIESRFEILDL